MLGVLKTADSLDAIAVRRLVAEHGIGLLQHATSAIAGEPRPVLTDDGRRALANYRDGAEAVPVFPLRGSDLLERGVKPGPHMGELLDRARRTWIEEGCPTDEDAARLLLERAVAEV
jgi:poly(A) polymerase